MHPLPAFHAFILRSRSSSCCTLLGIYSMSSATMQCFDSGLFCKFPVLLPACTLVSTDVPWPLPVLSHNSRKKQTIHGIHSGNCCGEQKAKARKRVTAEQSRVGAFVVFRFASGGSMEVHACMIDSSWWNASSAECLLGFVLGIWT